MALVETGKFIRLKRGLDINLLGSPEPTFGKIDPADTVAVKPTDFQGLYMAKPLVNEGDAVKAGTPLFYDKREERILYVAPVSGEVAAIKRGAKRRLEEIVILADKTVEYVQYGKRSISDIINIKVDEAQKILLEGGVWPCIVQRPYGIVADPSTRPKAIYVSTFDSHPLAPNYSVLFKGQESFFKAGIEVLKKFTSGKIHLNTHAEKEIPSFVAHVEGVLVNKFSGPHPAGCVGIQIHHIDPINKGDIVWTINPFGVAQVGKLFLNGVHDASRTVALVGSCVKKPQYYQTYTGASVRRLIANNLTQENVRVISGNVLTGVSVGKEGHLGYFDHYFTVIPEGEERRFLGWATPVIDRPSFHRAFGILSFLRKKSPFSPSSVMNGDPRAFVQTGTFEGVTPMDLLPTYLLKSILAQDIDEMEELGIYEVIEEDLALCEFIDVSKQSVQQIVRDGIELLRHS